MLIKKLFVLCCLCLSFLAACEKKKENIILYTSQHNKDIAVVIDAFQKQHPDIHVEVFRSGTTEVINKLLLEVAKDQFQADVIMISDAIAMENLKRKGLLSTLEGIEIESASKVFYDADKTYCGTKSISIGLVFNKNLEVKPSSFTDLNKPEFKDHIVIGSPLYSGAAALMLSILVDDPKFGWDFYKNLKANNVKVVDGNRDVVETISKGEKKLGIVVDFMAFNAKNKGAPIDFSYPEEGIIMITEPIALIKKKDEHKKAYAKKFVQFVLSHEGQEIAKNQGYKCIREAHSFDKRIMPINTEKVLKNFEENIRRFSELFSK